jgi:hypothetical protein
LGGLTSPRVAANDGKPTKEALSQEVLNLKSRVLISLHWLFFLSFLF